MKQITISGIIGWDATAGQLREALAEANGADAELLISSPGGFVGEGIEMFNLVRNYPGKITARLSGYVMSMASYIALAANRIVAEDNAIYMIHNVHGGAFGDHNYILKYGATVKAMSGMLGRAYAQRTGQSPEEVAALMDAETYYFGADIVEAGFADEVITVDGEHDLGSASALARLAFEECQGRMAADLKALRNDLTRAAALAGRGSNTPQPRAKAPEPKGAPIMTLDKLRADHPELVAALVAEATEGLITAANLQQQIATARAEGAEAERQRIADVRAQLIPGHEAVIETLAADGQSTGADAAKAIVAAEKVLRGQAARNLEEEAPPIVPGADASGAQKTLKRKDFNALTPAAQSAFVTAGGKIID